MSTTPTNGAATPERRDRAWGHYEVLFACNKYQVRRLVVSPKCSLEYQFHEDKNEEWFVAEGKAEIRAGWERQFLKVGDSKSIPAGMPHWISNPSMEPLVIVEIQHGHDVRDDDSVKLADYEAFKEVLEAWGRHQ